MAHTFVTATWNVNSEIGLFVLFEYERAIVMTAGEFASRETFSSISKLVLLTVIVFEDEPVSGKAEEKAHSSSSAGGGATTVGGGLGFAKSNIEGDCSGVDCLGAFRAAKGSMTGACCFARFAACCC